MPVLSDPAAAAAWNRARYSAYAPLYDLVVAPLAAGRSRSVRRHVRRGLGERLIRP
jgi:hypothetical protein